MEVLPHERWRKLGSLIQGIVVRQCLKGIHTIYGYNTDNPWIIDAAMLRCGKDKPRNI